METRGLVIWGIYMHILPLVRAPHPHRNAARLTYVANGLASQVLVADLLTALHVDDFSVSGGVGKFHTFYPRV